MNKLGIKKVFVLGIVFVVVLSQLVSGLLQYRQRSASARSEIRHIADAVMRPLVNLGTRGVDGGNMMILSNAEAKSLYSASQLKYLSIDGTSTGSAKTEFADAIPPQKIHYEFVTDGAPGQTAKIAASALAASGFDEANFLYVAKLPLADVKNGGEIVAVFPADQLKGLEWRVLSEVLVPTLLILLTSSVIAFLVARHATAPIIGISRRIDEAAKSLDLRTRMDVDRDDEVGRIAEAFNSLIENLQKVLHEITSASDEVFASTNLVNSKSAEIADATEHQRERSATMAASVEQLTVSVTHVANRAKDAQTVADEASHTAAEGEAVVRQAVGEMGRIADSVNHSSDIVAALGTRSAQISGIVKSIRDIADQTNLLALNAAIEAARAGEQGRGFAVVADEVRKLAERTNGATGEIGAMIESIQNEISRAVESMREGSALVSEGVVLANKAGEALVKINEGTRQTAYIVEEIASATNEQSGASTDIAQSVEVIAQKADANRAMCNDTVQTTKNLERLAASLKGTASRFTI